MRRLLPLAFLALVLVPEPAHAWGTNAHYFIMGEAIALLPPELRPLFEKERAFVVERMVDPDTWRSAGFTEEDPNHFLDIDVAEYGKYPFDALPRDWDTAVRKFGVATLRSHGLVPWRAAEVWGSLRRAFEAYPSRGAAGRTDVLLFAAWLSHYTSDAHQPFHGIANYNGQLSNQTGVHARFESVLFDRYRQQLRVAPKAIAPVSNPRDFIFDAVLVDTTLAPRILEADLRAIGDRDVYDDAYFEAFFGGAREVMERRLNDSIAAVAAMITGAWEAAGKPVVAVDPPATVQRRRR
jgi:hypothetical protein